MQLNSQTQNSRTMKAITLSAPDNGYNEIICRHFTQRFPKAFKANKAELLEIITEILIGNKDLRYGSMPKVEKLVKVRDTITKSISANLPIPTLVPWGGRKGTAGYELDTAEVSALYQLINLDEQIRRYYEPGLLMNVRIEDLNAYWLYRNDNKSVVPDTDRYSDGMVNLIKILGVNTKIEGVKESCMMDAGLYWKTAEGYSDLIFNYLMVSNAFPDDAQSTDEWKKLAATGWKGIIPKDQREYYIQRYKAWDPYMTDMQATRKLADYFGGSKARLDLHGKGAPETEVGSYIQLNFTPPVIGAPDEIFNNTLYIRTVPLKDARSHIAPWRAKGYLEISGDRVKDKIASFNDAVLAETIPGNVKISNDDGTLVVDVQSDHIIIENLSMYYSFMGTPII